MRGRGDSPDRIMPIGTIALDLAGAVKAAAGDRSLYATASNAAAIAPLVQMVAAAQAELCRKTKAKAPWVGYLGRDPEANVIVGSCSFKDVCRDGDVEIAYFTFPQSEAAAGARAWPPRWWRSRCASLTCRASSPIRCRRRMRPRTSCDGSASAFTARSRIATTGLCGAGRWTPICTRTGAGPRRRANAAAAYRPSRSQCDAS